MLTRQPVVEHLLDGPGGFAQCVEPDHPARPLEGVKAATQGGHRFRIERRTLADRPIGLDRRKHFAGFLEEDRHQFGIGTGIIRHRVRHSRRHIDHGWLRDKVEASFGVVVIDNKLGRVREHRHRRLVDRLNQRRRDVDGLRNLDRRVCRRGFRQGCLLAVCHGLARLRNRHNKACDEAILVMVKPESAMMAVGIAQRLGKESECTKVVSHSLAIGFFRRVGGIKEGGDSARHRIGTGGSLIMSEKPERAAHLPQQCAKGQQIGAGTRIAEKGIKHPLASAKIDLQFANEGLQRQSSLRGARQLGQPFRHGFGVTFLTLAQGIESIGQFSRTTIVLINLGRSVLERLLDKEQGSRQFERQQLSQIGAACNQHPAQAANGGSQALEAAPGQARHRGFKLLGRTRKGRQIGRTATGELLPGGLGLSGGFAGCTQTTVVDQTVMHPVDVGRDSIDQIKGLFDFIDLRGTTAGSGDLKEQFANHLVRHCNAGLMGALDLLVDPGDFALGNQIDRQGLDSKTIQKGDRQPPEGPQRRRLTGMQQSLDRLAHLADRTRIARIAKKAKHAALKA